MRDAIDRTPHVIPIRHHDTRSSAHGRGVPAGHLAARRKAKDHGCHSRSKDTSRHESPVRGDGLPIPPQRQRSDRHALRTGAVRRTRRGSRPRAADHARLHRCLWRGVSLSQEAPPRVASTGAPHGHPTAANSLRGALCIRPWLKAQTDYSSSRRIPTTTHDRIAATPCSPRVSRSRRANSTSRSSIT